MLLKKEISQEISTKLVTKFGLVFDAWSSSGIHFVCLFASSPLFSVLLKFSPFENEENLSAQSLKDFVLDTLEIYGKTLEDVLFLVSDNCSVNICLASRLELPLIGCASHRFNLAVKEYLHPHESVLKKINELMKKFSTIKGKAWLSKRSHLRPVMRNSTRWSITFTMVDRFLYFRNILNDLKQRKIQNLGLDKLLLNDCEYDLTVRNYIH
jgi:hypothetical protein